MLRKLKRRKKYFKLRSLGELHRVSGIELGFKNKKRYCFYDWRVGMFFLRSVRTAEMGYLLLWLECGVSQKQRVNIWCWGAGPLVSTALNYFLQTATGHQHFTIAKVRRQIQIQIYQHYFLACTTLQILSSSQINWTTVFYLS